MRHGFPIAAAIMSLALVHAQNGTVAPIEVLRLNGPPLEISKLWRSWRHGRSNSSPRVPARLWRQHRPFERSERRESPTAGNVHRIFPNAAESAEEIRTFCQDSGFIFPCYSDSQHKAANQLGATVTPEAFGHRQRRPFAVPRPHRKGG